MKKVFAEIVNIGDEILYGQITNTNVQWLSTELDKIGVKVVRHSTVADEEAPILQILAEAASRADLILITGGLGPTKDDITKKTLAKYFDTELVINETILAHITAFFEARGREMNESNRLQAAMPAACTPIFNRLGTAPGMWFEQNGKVFVSMPGVPKEMEILMEDSILAKIQAFFQTPVIHHKVIHTIGIGESMLADAIADWEDSLPPHIKLAYLPNWGQVRLRLTGMGEDKEKLVEEVHAEMHKVLPLIDKYVFGFDNDELEAVLGETLAAQGKTIATAESCTGGYLAHLFTKVPKSSRYFMGGAVVYSNQAKIDQLGVLPETIDEHGAVSEATIREMAMRVREVFKTDIGLASSGIAGPDGGTPEKPVGTIWIGYADGKEVFTKKLLLTQDRLINIRMTANILLDTLRRKLKEMY
ncbi:MAG TPA: competence/damage-inducible protein A [Microscillaceae bacterium]|nr:competence/damage-inducible protein A [Microscillaceae bacterium]